MMMQEFYVSTNSVPIIIEKLFKNCVHPTMAKFFEEEKDALDMEVKRFKREMKYYPDKDCYSFNDKQIDDFISQCVSNFITVSCGKMVDAGIMEMGWSENNGGEPNWRMTELGLELLKDPVAFARHMEKYNE